jgi:hypothetical protein
MTTENRREGSTRLRRRLWFLRERLKDVTSDPALTAKRRPQKVAYYREAIAKARAGLLELEGH